MKKSKQQKPAPKHGKNKKGLKQALTVAAAVASLGASLGVNVDKTFAAAADNFRSPDTALETSNQDKDQLSADQHKIESIQQKGLPSAQHKTEADFLKLPAVQHKTESLQYKELPSAQHKGESTQLKYENPSANFLKMWNNKRLQNGNTFIILQGGRAFTRTPGGVQTPAADGLYRFQDGTTLNVKGGQILR